MAAQVEIVQIGTTVVYENRWMRVREDRVRRRDGSEGIYGIVEKPDFVVIAAGDGDEIHLVQQYRYPVRTRHWELPQGSWETAPGTDIFVLAGAELAEETGLTAAEMEHAGRLLLASGYSNQGYNIFRARGLTRGSSSLETEEQDLVTRAFKISQLEDMIRDGEINDATTVATFGLLRLRGML